MDIKKIFQEEISKGDKVQTPSLSLYPQGPFENGLFAIKYDEKVVGYAQLKKDQATDRHTFQFHNSDQSKSWVNNIFLAGINYQRVMFSAPKYDKNSDTIDYKMIQYDIEDLFSLLHEHGHAFENIVDVKASMLARIRLELTAKKRNNPYINLQLEIQEAIQLSTLKGEALTEEECLAQFTETDRELILRSEFEAHIFALTEMEKLLDFLEIDQVLGTDNLKEKILIEMANLAVKPYQSYVDLTTSLIENELKPENEFKLDN